MGTRKYITSSMGQLVQTIKNLEPNFREISENEIITICLSNKINDIISSQSKQEANK